MADVQHETQDTQDSQSQAQESPLDQKILNSINSAVSSHLKRHLAKLPEMIQAALPQPSVQTSETSSSKDKSSDAMGELQKLRTELETERKRGREKETYNSVRTYLSDKVRPEALESAVKVLKADELVKFKRDGSPMIKFSETEEYDLEEGLAQWLGSKEAQLFRPAPSAKVAGQKPKYHTAKVTSAGEPKAQGTPSQRTLEQLQKLGLSF